MQLSTPRLLEEYLSSGGTQDCPYCGKSIENATYGTIEVEGGQAWQKIACESCNRIWNDIYRMTGIEEVDEEGEPGVLYEPQYVVISTQNGILDSVEVFTGRIAALIRGREHWKSITGHASMAEQQGHSEDEMYDTVGGYSSEWGGIGEHGYIMHWTDQENDVWVALADEPVAVAKEGE